MSLWSRHATDPRQDLSRGGAPPANRPRKASPSNKLKTPNQQALHLTQGVPNFLQPQLCQLSNKRILGVAFDILKRLCEKPLPPKKRAYAIVLDIDGTSVYNYNTEDETSAFYQKHRCNKEMYAIYRWALEHGVAVFFVTARPILPGNREYTVADLHKSGYTDWEELIMRPASDTGDNYSAYKQAARLRISRGYELLMNFGDTFKDMTVLVDEHRKIPLNSAYAFLPTLSDDKCYLLVLPGSVPAINIKLKTERK